MKPQEILSCHHTMITVHNLHVKKSLKNLITISSMKNQPLICHIKMIQCKELDLLKMALCLFDYFENVVNVCYHVCYIYSEPVKILEPEKHLNCSLIVNISNLHNFGTSSAYMQKKNFPV